MLLTSEEAMTRAHYGNRISWWDVLGAALFLALLASAGSLRGQRASAELAPFIHTSAPATSETAPIDKGRML